MANAQRYLLLWLLLLARSVCVATETVPLLQDEHFSRGVRITPLTQKNNTRLQSGALRAAPVCLPLRDCSSQPLWQLQQWSTAQDIAVAADTPPRWSVQDPSQRTQKSLVLAPGDAVDGDVQLALDGYSEFAARSDNGVPQYLPDLRRPWPHWLLSQQLDSGRLSHYRQLLLHGEVNVLFDQPQREPGFDPAIHAARLVLAMTVRNRLTGDYFWLTLPLYDDRYSHSEFGCQKCLDNGERCYTPQQLDDEGVWRCPEDRVGDQWWRNEKPGTARMIFRLPTRPFLHGDVRAGGWVQVKGDVLPYLQAGIEAVRQRQNGRTFPADLFFYEPGLFSIGWEITGFNKVAVQLRNWQLEGVQR